MGFGNKISASLLLLHSVTFMLVLISVFFTLTANSSKIRLVPNISVLQSSITNYAISSIYLKIVHGNSTKQQEEWIDWKQKSFFLKSNKYLVILSPCMFIIGFSYGQLIKFCLLLIAYAYSNSKTCFIQPLKRRLKVGFQDG